MRRNLYFAAMVVLLSSTILAHPFPSADTTAGSRLDQYMVELELQAAITNYVYDLYLQYGDGKIKEEKYLLSLMELINQEMAHRLKSPKAARKQYFSELEGKLRELHQFKNRLNLAGIRELDEFIKNLSERIKLTIEEGVVDFKKKKIFEDALQMLYVSEEMIKLDRVQSNTDIAQKIEQSRQQLLAAFGEVDSQSRVTLTRQPTIYDLFAVWKETEAVKYDLRLADVYLLRKKMLNNGTREDVLRMFNRQLDLAYQMFNYQDYDLAERLLADLIATYPNYGIAANTLDDLYFYRAESNFALGRLLHAQQQYEAVVENFAGSSFLPRAYNRLVQIHYTLGDYAKVVEYATLNQNLLSTSDPEYHEVQFLAAMAFYEENDFDKTVEILLNIPRTHPYYHHAQYFIANAYADGQLTDQAMQTYTSIVNDNQSPPELRDRSLYKLGLIQYEFLKNYPAAIAYLTQVTPEFSAYDKILNALAWSHFEMERSKPINAKRDFSQAQLYARRLITEYYASPYRMEATGLLAYINQLSGEPGQAIRQYREVYEEKQKYGAIEDYLKERERLEALLRDAVSLKETALQSSNPRAFRRATDLIEHLRSEIETLDLAEASRSSVSMYNEANAVLSQIKEANQLKLMAEAAKNKPAVKRLDSLLYRLTAVLESFPPEAFTQSENINYFDAYPVSKYVAEEQFHHQQNMADQQHISRELFRVDSVLQKLEDQIAVAKFSGNFEMVSRLENKQRKLKEIRKEYDYLYATLNQTPVNPSPYPEFNRWGDLGAFGIISVYFDQKQGMQAQLAQVSRIFDRVNEELDTRKLEMEEKIKRIESQIRLMTMKARMEERVRLRAERERAFRESYFDTRESEASEEEN